MNKLLVFPIFVMFFFAAFQTMGAFGGTYTVTPNATGGSYYYTNETQYDPVTGTDTSLNGTYTENVISIPLGSFSIDMNNVQFGIVVMTSIIAIAAVAGIRALGTGVSDVSIEIIVKTAFYISMWGILTAISQPLFAGIPVFGGILYIGLTVMYLYGWMGTIRGGSGSE